MGSRSGTNSTWSHSTWTWDVPVLHPPRPESSPFHRMWLGFMMARMGTAVTLLVLLGALMVTGVAPWNYWQLALCATYLAASVAVRIFTRPSAPGRSFDPQWVSTIGIDLLAFSTLHFLQAAGLSYSPLFALPVLTASVLGSTLLALGTAAGVTMLLLVDGWLQSLEGAEHTSRLVQAALTGGGYFVVALLANQLAVRLAREEMAARQGLSAARTQAHVNELVIDTLSDGLLVIGMDWRIHAANPAARSLLGWQAREAPASLALVSRPGWRPLAALAQRTFDSGDAQTAEIALELGPGERLHLKVRTRLTPPQDPWSQTLCVMFLQDLREAEAQVRTEKLAAMGRMSAAVAHEIRNPLAAISQANGLLSEELTDPSHQQLAALVRKNSQRLSQIVEEILNLARVQAPTTDWLELDQVVEQFVAEWQRHAAAGDRVHWRPGSSPAWAAFDGEHLRRILVNLLDNALRHASGAPGAIVVATDLHLGQARMTVWSDGAPLDPGVQRHLFEPFFSSQSRSSGLGLYICRELCDRHGALITYARSSAPDGSSREGNAFSVTFRTRTTVVPDDVPLGTIRA
ncbi:PAS domain-containing protein [Ramlibacter sp. USB13]|uniref:histidine kinase n=1 Tax=Ramlibacter cellulosilyticus TaxID=2764187 RepID=A0A923SCN8_9BURK|nr:ATP-binding protein [Ramlibacter cellulosilyticus]MBC5785155.1 PAS domain-containing protein [Ramlibacter cellulosilyticus]